MLKPLHSPYSMEPISIGINIFPDCSITLPTFSIRCNSEECGSQNNELFVQDTLESTPDKYEKPIFEPAVQPVILNNGRDEV